MVRAKCSLYSRQAAKKTFKALLQVLCHFLAPLRLCARLIRSVFFSNVTRISRFSQQDSARPDAVAA
jgi:hypothetical protein